MAAGAVGDRLRREETWIVEACRVDRDQVGHRSEGQVDRRAADRAEGVQLLVAAISYNPSFPRLARHLHLASAGEG